MCVVLRPLLQADTTEHEDEGAGDLYGFAQECLDRQVLGHWDGTALQLLCLGQGQARC